jgi:hypothetical protein
VKKLPAAEEKDWQAGGFLLYFNQAIQMRESVLTNNTFVQLAREGFR